MDFIKKHYEKILLGVVLLSLAVAVVFLPFYINSQKQDLIDKRTGKLNPTVKALTNLDESRYTAAYQRMEKSVPLNLSKPHHLFNPVQWQKKPDSTLIKVQEGTEVGAEALQATKVNPLYTTIKFESVGPSTNYFISVTRDADPNPKLRRKKEATYNLGEKRDFMQLVEVKGPGEKPEGFIVILSDTGATVTVQADHPFQRVDGYSADLRYDPEKGVWLGRRVNDKINFAGDEFTVVSINLIATNQFEVILSAKSTGKKTTVKYSSEM